MNSPRSSGQGSGRRPAPLFDAWDAIAPALTGPLFLMFDFDGTLAPIAAVPERAVMDSGARNALAFLAGRSDCTIAIVSGRSLGDIRRMVGLPGLIYAGNHGLELAGPGLSACWRPGAAYRSGLERIRKALIPLAHAEEGIRIEDKGVTISAHYRAVPASRQARVRAALCGRIEEAADGRTMRIVSGKKVVEIRPRGGWDKGKVVLWLLARKRINDRADPLQPWYIGDDLTDEDAFAALEGKGVTVIVGKRSSTRARYYLDDVAAVAELLGRIARALT